MTTDLISKIKAATEQLTRAQGESTEYLNSINEVLIKVHQEFTQNMERSLSSGNREFQKELASAVGMVSAAIADLGDTLDDLPRTPTRR